MRLIVAMLLCLGAEAGAQASRAPAGLPLRLQPLLGVDEYLPTPDDNPLTREGASLGRRLFFDKLLSGNQRLACASCHQPGFSFSDTAALSRGARGQRGQRRAPALINRAWGITFFWDGRASSLEEQVLQPIQDSSEMDLPIAQLVARLRVRADYRAAFASTFPDGVSAQNVARALASYVRTIRSGNSGLDRYETGDTSGLAPDARRGLTLFRGRANCTACHVGPNLTDERFHNTGVSTGTTDTGRYRVTGKDADRGAFKTPTLRDVARTRPYMHDGSLATLQDVVEFYDRGGRPSPALDAEIHRLGLSPPEKAELVAFLRSLSGTLTAAPPYGHR